MISEVDIVENRITILNSEQKPLLYASIDGDQQCCEEFGFNLLDAEDGSILSKDVAIELLINREIQFIRHEMEDREVVSEYNYDILNIMRFNTRCMFMWDPMT